MPDFAQRGVLLLPGLVPRPLVGALEKKIAAEWAKVNKAKLRKLPIFQQASALHDRGIDVDVFPNELVAAVNATAGATLLRAGPPQLLVSPPRQGDWSLDALNWHVDLRVPGIQAFVLIDDVAPKSGATLALSGSHKLQAPHRILRSHPADTFLKPRMIDGVELQIVEMTGRAGDVYLMDLRTLHSPSINASKNLRMMATLRFVPTKR